MIAGCEFTTGHMNGVDVIFLRSGIGKVNAAMSTTILLEKYNPDYVINTGSAGGYNPELNVGDLLFPQKFVTMMSMLRHLAMNTVKSRNCQRLF